MSEDFEKIVGEEYQDIAYLADQSTSKLLIAIHDVVHEGGGGDGGPILVGTITALLRFALAGQLSNEQVRTMLVGMIDDMLPQARKDADEAKAMFGKTAGHA